MFGSLSTCPVECRLLAALLRRIPQGENLRFICNLVLGIWDFEMRIGGGIEHPSTGSGQVGHRDGLLIADVGYWMLGWWSLFGRQRRLPYWILNSGYCSLSGIPIA
jgi:hypothetical protein